MPTRNAGSAAGGKRSTVFMAASSDLRPDAAGIWIVLAEAGERDPRKARVIEMRFFRGLTAKRRGTAGSICETVPADFLWPGVAAARSGRVSDGSSRFNMRKPGLETVAFGDSGGASLGMAR